MFNTKKICFNFSAVAKVIRLIAELQAAREPLRTPVSPEPRAIIIILIVSAVAKVMRASRHHGARSCSLPASRCGPPQAVSHAAEPIRPVSHAPSFRAEAARGARIVTAATARAEPCQKPKLHLR